MSNDPLDHKRGDPGLRHQPSRDISQSKKVQAPKSLTMAELLTTGFGPLVRPLVEHAEEVAE